MAGQGAQPEILLAEHGTEIAELARRAVQEGSAGVIAGGGDGTVNAVAAQLVGTGIPLGILPLGTLNHFAKELHIPQEREAALRSLLTGRIVSVDAAEVNGRPFVNNSSLGLYPWLVAEREKEQRKGHGKWAAFAQAGFSVLRRYPFLDVTLIVDGRELHYRTPFVFIGNNKYTMQAFRIGERETLSGGELCLFVAARGRRRDLLKLALWALLGRASQVGELQSLSAREVFVTTRRRRLRVALDGEVTWMESPLHYRSLPAALRVIVPTGEARAA
jgi:diacylglycerol kinase family enzyme